MTAWTSRLRPHQPVLGGEPYRLLKMKEIKACEKVCPFYVDVVRKSNLRPNFVVVRPVRQVTYPFRYGLVVYQHPGPSFSYPDRNLLVYWTDLSPKRLFTEDKLAAIHFLTNALYLDKRKYA